MAKDARSQAVAVLRQVLQFGHSLSAELPKAIEQTDSAQIGLLQELSLGTLRQFHYLDARLRAHLKTPLKTKDTDIYCILLVAAYQLLYLDKPDYAVVSSAVELCKKRKKTLGRQTRQRHFAQPVKRKSRRCQQQRANSLAVRRTSQMDL